MVKLILLWLAVVLCVIIRVMSQPDGYTTTDSHAYIFKVANISKHQSGTVPFGAPGPHQLKVASANWPIGYPLLIFIVHRITSLSFLWSSKVVNLIALGLIFSIFHHWSGNSAWFMGLSFVSYGAFDLYSYTWSEGAFLFL